jgi:hypothetical protein
MGLSFTIPAGPRQRSRSQVRVPRGSWPHFTVSDTRLPQHGGPCPRIYRSQEQGCLVTQALGTQSQSYVTTVGQSASLSWNKAPIWGLRPDLYYCQLQACWHGALSLTRGRVYRLLESRSAVISLLSLWIVYILHVIKCMHIQHMQGLCQFGLSTADHALSLVAPATTAVYSLERSYAWPPPSLSLLYFLPRGSPCPMLRTFAFSLFCMTSWTHCINCPGYNISVRTT